MQTIKDTDTTPVGKGTSLNIAQLRRLGEALNAAVFDWDFEHGTVYFSKECSPYTLCHEDPDAILHNQASLDNIHPEDVPALLDFFRKINNHLMRAEVVLRLHMIDGSFRRSRLIALFQYGKNGNIISATGLIINIENDASQEIAQSTFLNALPTGIGIYNISNGKATQLYVNDGFYHLVRDTRAARDARNGDDFLHSVYPEDHHLIIDGVHRIVQGEDEVNVICRVYTGDDDITWLRFTARAAQRHDNTILVYVVYSNMDTEISAQQLMQQRQNMLNAAISSAKMSVWEYDARTHSVTGNMGDLHQHGNRKTIYNVPEFLIESHYIRDDFVDAYRALFRDVVEKNTTVQNDFPVREDVSGTENFWWERVILTPVTDIEGHVIKAVGVSIDVSEQKSREERYLKQVDALTATNDATVIGKGQYNLSRNTMLYFNPLAPNAVHAESDMCYDDVLRSIQAAALYPAQRAALGRMLDRKTLLQGFLLGKTDVSFEYARAGVDGSTAWARTHVSLFEEPESQDIIAFCYSFDITEQVLKQNIIEHFGALDYDIVGTIDMRTHCFKLRKTQVDSSHSAFIPYDDYDTLVVTRMSTMVVPEQREAVQQQVCFAGVVKGLQAKTTYTVTYSTLEKNGERRRKKALYCYLDGEKSTIFFCRTDITDIFRKEQHQLHQTQLALESAKAASQAKTDFLSNMSHDMRTPMNGIIGMVELALENEDDAQQVHESLSIIHNSSLHLLQLINDILDMSRIESGHLKLESKNFIQSEEIHSVTSNVRVLAQEKGLQFSEDIQIAHDLCIGDAEKLRRILNNVLGNAIKFTPQGGHISLQVQEQKNPNSHMRTFRYIIQDDGIGMDVETQAHIFDTFYRADTEYVNKTEGTGLGLSIAKNIVELAGGTLRVNSAPGQGTCFTVDIPLLIAQDNGGARCSTLPQPGTTLQYDLSGVRLLLVEDHPINRVVAQRLLEKVHASVVCVENGRAALEYFTGEAGRTIDAILMDIQMPVMNGYEATKAIRACGLPNATTIPIIAMTANAFASDVRQCLDCGMNEHVTKPIHPDVLYSTICRYVGSTHVKAKKRILVVDDVEVNLAVIRQALEHTYEVLTAGDGVQALAALKKYDNIVAVITDIQMPNMDGTALIRTIRHNHANDHIAVLVNTQYGDSNQEEELLALGADDFIYKPTSPLVIYNRLSNILVRYHS